MDRRGDIIGAVMAGLVVTMVIAWTNPDQPLAWSVALWILSSMTFYTFAELKRRF